MITPPSSVRITLATINARYIHCAFGLRYLYANMDNLRPQTRIREYTLEQRPLDIAEQLLADTPDIIGLGVYIWNATQSLEVVRLLRTLSPETTLVLGGPEVSHETSHQEIVALADFVITGNAEKALPALCRQIIDQHAPLEKVIHPTPVPLNNIALPYPYYGDTDIAHRIIYVEASRGCPFKCAFCLSALDKTAKAFPIEAFIAEMQRLYQRGARQFKFVDRTFNLSANKCTTILEFFLERILKNAPNDLFLHFELIPDHLPDSLKKQITKFPPGSLQFEIGIQTFNPDVQALIDRKQDNTATLSNLCWLRTNSHAHLHTDLIFGLPGESLSSMAASFDQLVALKPHEIQVGILKRLKGMPMTALESEYALVFSPQPPFEILSTSLINFPTMQRLRRFARYWDLIGNSGRFPNTLPWILGDAPFKHFMMLSDWLHRTSRQTHKISLKRLFRLLADGIPDALGVPSTDALAALSSDYQRSGLKGRFQAAPGTTPPASTSHARPVTAKNNRRQQTHLQQI